MGSSPFSSPTEAKAQEMPPPVPAPRVLPAPLRFLVATGRIFKSWIFATLACMSVPLAILFAGWTYRLVQHRAHKLWTIRLGKNPDSRRTLPRWFLSERSGNILSGTEGTAFHSRITGILRALLGSLGANWRTGSLITLNSFLVTLPGGMIMMFSWYSGWDNSFKKGYEQAGIGPLWGLIGICLFMVAMTYIPIAQARQAITGSTRAFWSYRKVRDVIRARPMTCLVLSGGYTFLGAIFMVAVSALTFVGNGDSFEGKSSAEIVSFLNAYYFRWAAFFIVPGFLLLKLIAGRIYAGASYDAIVASRWQKDEVTDREQKIFEHARVAETPPASPGLMRTGLAAFSFIGRLFLRAATLLLLLLFALELYIAQFFTFEPATNWLRQPMVQLPWYHSIPKDLK